MAVDAGDAAEFVALRIVVQRLFALVASTQPDPAAFLTQQLKQSQADVDRYGVISDSLEGQKLIRNEAKAILANLFHGMTLKS